MSKVRLAASCFKRKVSILNSAGVETSRSVLSPSQKLPGLLVEGFLPAPRLGTFYWVVGKSKNGKKSLHGVR